jgi:hypothetical protein
VWRLGDAEAAEVAIWQLVATSERKNNDLLQADQPRILLGPRLLNCKPRDSLATGLQG